MSEPRHFVLYDDGCPLCTFQVRMLEWLDWLDVARVVGISDPRVAELAPQIARAELLEAIHCIRGGETESPSDRRVHRGARALRFLGLRMPLLTPLSLLLFLPGVLWIAEAVYAGISRNRHRLGRLFGCKTACKVMPRRRDGDRGDDPEA